MIGLILVFNLSVYFVAKAVHGLSLPHLLCDHLAVLITHEFWVLRPFELNNWLQGRNPIWSLEHVWRLVRIRPWWWLIYHIGVYRSIILRNLELVQSYKIYIICLATCGTD